MKILLARFYSFGILLNYNFFILLANPLHILIHSFLNSNFELGSQDGDENQTNGTPPIDTESAHVK